jgi:hypothetical protein
MTAFAPLAKRPEDRLAEAPRDDQENLGRPVFS